MIPKPPTWIKKRITISPNKVKELPVSITANPVTVVAEAAVNKASIQDIECVVAIGSFNKNVPSKIKQNKIKINNLGGFTC